MIGMVAKKMFFDSPAVMSAVDKATRRVLSKFGAYVRTAARSSIRTRRKVSEPGRPPSSHTGLLKKFIFFAYEPERETVVIGPAPLHGRGYGNVLEALEYGGRFARFRAARRRRRRYMARYRARPFMGPAFEKEQAKLPAMWAGSVR